MPLETPPPVRRAIYLLWASLLLSIVDSVLSPESIGEACGEFQTFMVAALVGIFAINGLLIYFASQRYNWARIVLLLLTVIGWSSYFVLPTDISALQWWSWMLTGVMTILDIAAFIILFSGGAAKWYSSQSAR
jgi:hypothetical protein